MNRFISALIVCLLYSGIRAQTPESVATKKASERVKVPDSVIQAVDQVFAEFDNSGSPGCAVGVVRDDDLILARGYGMAGLEHDVGITPQSASTLHRFPSSLRRLPLPCWLMKANSPLTMTFGYGFPRCLISARV